MTLYNDFVKADASTLDKQSLSISALETDGRPIKIEDKYYNKEVWYALSKVEQAEVLKLRNKGLSGGGSGDGGGKSSGGSPKGNGSSQKGLKKQIANLQAKSANQKRQLAALNAKVAGGSDADSESGSSSDDDSQVVSNRTHSDLTREKKKSLKKAKTNKT